MTATRLTKRASAGAFVLAATLGLGTTSVLPAHSAVSAVAAAPSGTTTTLALKSATIAYGDTSKAIVTVDTATSGDPKPVGKVELEVGGQTLVAGVPNGGRVEFDLPLLAASTTPYAVTATFIPTDPAAFSQSTAPPASVTVTKDATTSRVTARHRVVRRLIIAKNLVTSANGQVPTGEVKFVLRRNGVKIATSIVGLDGSRDASRNFARTKFRNVPKRGSYKVVGKYRGSANFRVSRGSFRIIH
ncbi:Ig-like domain-containing protein [Nocardioides sp.]|uniref:Ig-like domain-containing protein n=1 Tax=Nocardioides sp. TaxID=35761 RepID=UPI001A2FB975|nr:Ig-like domain-containing protein [Nocardioides sp.]MBJ7356868.1 Ig-like domain repeat protein [Nocardioides sp.]